MDKLLNELLEKLTRAYGGDLISVILYGSAVTGDHHQEFSDINIFCVLRQITPKELAASEPIFHWWRQKNYVSPLLMSENEVHRSTDCFPIEFHDMQERRRVLFGSDVMEGLTIDDVFYRAEIEHELRGKLLRLRQKAAGILSDGDLLLRLMLDSVSTFCVLARHALRLSGQPAPFAKREIVQHMKTAFGMECRAFDTLLDLREGRTKPARLEPLPIFESYLKEIEALVVAADQIAR